LRNYLLSIKKQYATTTYKNILSSLKRYYRDFLNKPKLVESFKFPQIPFKPITAPTKKELQAFYSALEISTCRTLFLFYTTSGMRKSEVLNLNKVKNTDYKKRMITPNKEGNQSKHTWISFCNREAEQGLTTYLYENRNKDHRLFPKSARQVFKTFKKARKKSGIRVTPQSLRDFFCCEMGNLGVSDRYVDAFCGRTPKSVLARHYTAYNPERLKKIYDNANLKILI